MIQDILPRYQEVANGSKKAFIFPFDVLKDEFIEVYVDSDKVTSGWTLSASQKKIIFETEPASGKVITIYRNIPVEWLKSIGTASSVSIDEAVTYLVAQIQTIKEGLSRAIQTRIIDTDKGSDVSDEYLNTLGQATALYGQCEVLLAQIREEGQDIVDLYQDFVNRMANLISTDVNLGNSDLVVPSQKAVKTYVDSNCVKISTEQTITGQKTFTQNILLNNSSESFRHIYSNNSAVTKGTTPSENAGTDFVFRDSASSNIGAVSMWYNAVGSTRAAMRAYDPVAGTSTSAEFVITNYANGSAQLNFTTSNDVNNTSMYGVSNSNNDSVVPTKGWVNNPATSTNVVHRSGNETISGNKTFIDNFIHFKTDIAYNETPLANKYGGFNFLDKNDSEISSFYTGLYTNGTGLSGFNLKNKSGDSARLSLRYNPSGIFYTEAPTPTDTTSTNGTQIATTGWVNGTSHNLVHKSGNETIAGTKTFSTTPIVGTKGNSDSTTSAASTAYVHNILAALYPVGSIYIGTQDSCPLATLISGSTWSLVSKGRALWGGNGTAGSGTTDPSNYNNAPANTTITAGLPNITGTITAARGWGRDGLDATGAFKESGSAEMANTLGGYNNANTITLDASKSSSIYGKSTTVQPYAYVVNVWRRTK